MSNPSSRRQFLTTAGGTALATWGILPRRVWGAGERLRVAVMGVNGRGRALARGFSRLPQVEVAYLCDPDQTALESAVAEISSEMVNPPRLVKDFREALDDRHVDALAIAAPDHWHAPATILACQAGKHVYVEKPACHNMAEGESMVAAARQHGRRVQLGTQRRGSPSIREAVAELHGGRLGTVRFARGWINSTRPNIGFGRVTAPPAHLDWELWQGPAPERPYRDNVVHYRWHWFWDWGTGELGNNGIHALDVCRWGLQVQVPEQVACQGAKLFFVDDQETPDTQLATFRFGDKMISWEHRTWHKRGFEGSLYGVQFYGDEGSLAVANEGIVWRDMAGKILEKRAGDLDERAHFLNFVQAIRDDVPLHAEIEEGVRSTLLCHLGNMAYRAQQTVAVDVSTGRPEDEELFEKFGKRPYRPGWEFLA